MKLLSEIKRVAYLAWLSFPTILCRLLGIAAALALNVVIARILGPEATGEFFLILAIVIPAGLVSRLGFENVLLRFVAASAARGDWSGIGGLYRNTMRASVLCGAAITLILWATAPIVSRQLHADVELAAPLRIGVFAIVPLAILWLHGELVKALGRPAQSAVIQTLLLPLIACIGALVIFGLIGKTSVGAVSTVYVLSASISCLVAIGLWRNQTSELRRPQGMFSWALLITTAMPLLAVNLLDISMQVTSTICLGIQSTAEQVGIYGVALRIAMLTNFVMVSVNSVVAPQYAVLYASGDIAKMERLARHASGSALIAIIPIVLVFALLPRLVLSPFGDQFIEAAPYLLCLSIGQLIVGMTGAAGTLLLMSGRQKLVQYNLAVAALLNVGLNVALISRYGAMGAAIASASTIALAHVSLAVIAYWQLSVVTIPIPGWRCWPLSADYEQS